MESIGRSFIIMAVADFVIAIIGLLLAGVGLWWLNPGLSLSVVGGVLFVTSIVAQFTRQRKPKK